MLSVHELFLDLLHLGYCDSQVFILKPYILPFTHVDKSGELSNYDGKGNENIKTASTKSKYLQQYKFV